jgi:hypothetical protein
MNYTLSLFDPAARMLAKEPFGASDDITALRRQPMHRRPQPEKREAILPVLDRWAEFMRAAR